MKLGEGRHNQTNYEACISWSHQFPSRVILNHLPKITYRDVNIYNPLNITHPLAKETHPYLTGVERSAAPREYQPDCTPGVWRLQPWQFIHSAK